MGKDTQKLHDDPFYKATKTTVCAATAGLFSYFGSGSTTIFNITNQTCHQISDIVAEPAHVLVHGQTYEQKNKPKPYK